MLRFDLQARLSSQQYDARRVYHLDGNLQETSEAEHLFDHRSDVLLSRQTRLHSHPQRRTRSERQKFVNGHFGIGQQF